VETSADTGDGGRIAILLIARSPASAAAACLVLSRRRTAGSRDKSGKPAAATRVESRRLPASRRPAGKARDDVELFKKQTVDGKYRKGEFFDSLGSGENRIPGEYVYLQYHCTDGTYG